MVLPPGEEGILKEAEDSGSDGHTDSQLRRLRYDLCSVSTTTSLTSDTGKKTVRWRFLASIQSVMCLHGKSNSQPWEGLGFRRHLQRRHLLHFYMKLHRHRQHRRHRRRHLRHLRRILERQLRCCLHCIRSL